MHRLLRSIAPVAVLICTALPLLAQTAPTDWTGALPDHVGSGAMFHRSTEGLVALPVLDIEVELEVTGPLVHGRMSQTFHNPTADVIEALYVFPLPEGAAVHHMEMRIGERRIAAIVRERERARREYDAARDTGRRAARIERRPSNLFTAAAANINPGERVTLVLEYLEELSWVDGEFRLRFPLTYTPRHRPAESSPDPVSGGPAECDGPFVPGEDPRAPLARIVVRLAAGMRLDGISSASHAIGIDETASGYRVATRQDVVPADRDFLLSWRPRRSAGPSASAFVEEAGDDVFALLMILPPGDRAPAALGLPTETLFVIDVSGSMRGTSISQARRALLAALDRLRPEDRFNIVAFNDGSRAFRPGFEHAETEPLAAARDWVRGLEAGGGTAITPALSYGLALLGSSRRTLEQRIIFLTDGAVGNAGPLLSTIERDLGETRLHTIGIGAAPNAWLMRRMARSGRGLSEFVATTDQARNRIDAFFSRLARPVMTDVDLRWEGVTAEASYPARLPDLHAGEPLVVSARLSGANGAGRVILSGITRDGPIEHVLDVGRPAGRTTGVARRWARAKVASVLDSLHEGRGPESVRDEVVDLGLRFGLVTPYTSLVAVEDVPRALGDSRAVRMAAALPRGGTDRRWRLLLGLGGALAGLVLWSVSRRTA